MKPEDLQYSELKKAIGCYEEKGRGESIAFLNWFLECIFRLEEVDADDSICDQRNDRGIDGIYVDHTQEEILVLQSKIKQRESSIGDAQLRDLVGTLSQFSNSDSIQGLLNGGGCKDLKNLLKRNNLQGLLNKGYEVIGVFICNQDLDKNGEEFLHSNPDLRVYDRTRIASEYVDIETKGGIDGIHSFDASYVDPLILKSTQNLNTYILPVKATELVTMGGIEDGTLFSQNVRQSLGNTKVNKALKKSVEEKAEHGNFPLYHNGVNILCKEARLEDGLLFIENYVVVNGAQSISTFKRNEQLLTDDLRVIAKIVQLDDEALGRKITVNSNNQNAIKPRDLKSNNEIQVRLKEEFSRVEDGAYEFEIKRGQEVDNDRELVTNEEAGRLLMAYDLMEPESCHQVYKLFDSKYAEIFARPAVTAHRIIFICELMKKIRQVTPEIEYKPLANYGLTRFFLLSTVSKILQSNEQSRWIFKNPQLLFENSKLGGFLEKLTEVLRSLVIDINYEVKEMGDAFDYKSDFKSPSKISSLRDKLIRSYEKDLVRGKVCSLGMTVDS